MGNQVVENNVENGVIIDPAPNAGEKPPKKSLKVRIVSAFHSFRSKPIGRWTVRVAKGAGLLGVGIGGYALGRKSVKPTTVYITHDEPEEPEAEEAPAEETGEAEQNEE